jgi:hypothetical protein
MCGETFETLSRVRLHTDDCDGSKWPFVDAVELAAYGHQSDETPIVAFRIDHGDHDITVRDGGHYPLSVGVVEPESDEPQFAFLDENDTVLTRQPYDDEAKQFLDGILEREFYIVAANPASLDTATDESSDESDAPAEAASGLPTPVTYDPDVAARIDGVSEAALQEQFEHIGWTPVEDDGLSSVHDVQYKVGDPDAYAGRVAIDEIRDADFFGPLRSTRERAGGVLELVVMADEPEDPITELDTLTGLPGSFRTVILAENAPRTTPRRYALVPLPEARGPNNYSRVLFQTHDDARTWFETIRDTGEVDIGQLLTLFDADP